MFARFLPALLLPVAAMAAPVDFAREVLPILSDACFHCHGPDEKKREAELRLDTKEGLYRTKDDITVVAPGKPEASELVLRITSKDRDEVMPPPKANRTLKPEQVEVLKRWVAEGGTFRAALGVRADAPHRRAGD
jgi:mono/diheme cytochrome c family protein